MHGPARRALRRPAHSVLQHPRASSTERARVVASAFAETDVTGRHSSVRGLGMGIGRDQQRDY
jgi:hypothetical protein